MGVRHTREATSGAVPVPQGITANYAFASYTMSETASASTTLVMLRIPAGARITDAHLTIDNDALDATGGGQVSVQTRIGMADPRIYILTGSGSMVSQPFKPEHDAHGLVHSASANLVVQLQNFVNTGTAATIFSLSVHYDNQKANG